MANILDYQLSEQQLIQQFLNALDELPDVHAKSLSEHNLGNAQLDAQIDVKAAGKSFVLLVEAKKKAAYPRDVQQAIWQLRKASKDLNPNSKGTILILVSEYFSPGAKKLLQAEKVGYYDSGGSLYLPAPGAYIYIEKPPAKVFERSVRSLFSGRRAHVLHALLIHHQKWFGVHELAELAMVSPATASEVLSELERMDWMISKGKGPRKERKLTEPKALLDAWVKQAKVNPPESMSRYYVPNSKNDALLIRIGEEFSNLDYAVTSEAAAQLYTPFLTNISQVRVKLINSPQSQAAISALGARPVTEGSNLSIIYVESQDDLLFRNQLNNIWLVSPVQAYLDLHRGEGRSTEMAEHLRKEKLGF